jgi:hypothetical protein
VIGNCATPALEIFPSPNGAGVSFSVPSASTKPASSLTSVRCPDRLSILATGSGADAEEAPDDSSSPQAAVPSASTATVAMAASERNM